MNTFLIGTKKHGCLIDNEQHTITYYDLLSLYEKLKGKKHVQVFHYHEIHEIVVTYGIQDFFRSPTVTITLILKLKNHTNTDVIIFYNNTTRNDLLSFIDILKNSSLTLIDPYHIFEKIETTSQSIWEIISSIEKQRFEKRCQ
ncbi:hypothetical protein [Candidatus Stoquefichus massiliensis]|uniref:hypothetical protein n=1 Tax=Candidatus Stoquefichus massiliensis TaxID=1470350 RepID=UPI00048850D8|nr:hypothetical protein [Candidatus Stoquefichus massiliensis]